MTITKFNIDTKRQLVTIVLDNDKIITVTNGNQHTA